MGSPALPDRWPPLDLLISSRRSGGDCWRARSAGRCGRSPAPTLTGPGGPRATPANGIRARASSAGSAHAADADDRGCARAIRRRGSAGGSNEPQAAPHGGQGRQEVSARVGQRQHPAADNVVQKAIAAAQAGAFADAEARARTRCWRASPITSKRCIRRACCWRARDRVEDGIALLRRATAAKPGEAALLEQSGRRVPDHQSVRRRRGRPRPKAVRLDPKYVMAWRNLGDGARATSASIATPPRRWSTASAAGAERCRDLEPAGPGAARAGDAARAETAFAKAVALDPRNAECRSNLGVLLTKRGRAGDALPHLEKAAEIEPDRFTAALHFGIALALSGDPAKALRWLRRATSIKPNSDTRLGRARRCGDLGRRIRRGARCGQARRAVRARRCEPSRAPAQAAARRHAALDADRARPRHAAILRPGQGERPLDLVGSDLHPLTAGVSAFD